MDEKLISVLWFDGAAEEAARFYTDTFPDSELTRINRAPADFPSGKAGDVITVEFTLLGRAFSGLNGGPIFTPNESVSFMVVTEDQAETDRYWNAIVDNGGQESVCGWCKDKWGYSWQITPRTLLDALNAGGEESRRAFEAMMTMGKIDVATIDAAREGR
ncbi:VOC family protein [Tsuneonella suprasediminis]|uniref:VOC family protein n=1 Tax=Tsuneonella suprasediminis TaxID=2306996 RepID=UPI002F9573F4